MIGADAEFPHNALEGVRNIAKRYNLKIVYDKFYPPATADYTPVVRAVAATNPDIFFAASYPPDSVGIIRASHEIGFKPKIYGGGMVGLQATAIKTQLGPLLNDIVVYDFWLPWAGFATDAGREFVKKYQTESAEAGIDLLGYYLPPFGYALMQVVQQAVTAAGTTEDAKLADALRKGSFKTIVGDFKFNAEGEWDTPRSWPCSSRACRATASSSSRTRRPKSSCGRPSTRPATSSIRIIRRSDEPQARHPEAKPKDLMP